ncbi:hypothetical protein CHU98_g3552 [Xylaria longipes]|nr:hypothetical protein CHU98_g3552 [Xylaria longipes]
MAGEARSTTAEEVQEVQSGRQDIPELLPEGTRQEDRELPDGDGPAFYSPATHLDLGGASVRPADHPLEPGTPGDLEVPGGELPVLGAVDDVVAILGFSPHAPPPPDKQDGESEDGRGVEPDGLLDEVLGVFYARALLVVVNNVEVLARLGQSDDAAGMVRERREDH